MGLLLMRRGQFAESEKYLRKAIDTLTTRNPNPYDGEPYYNLGWALLLQNRLPEAYECFYKATWNDAWQHSGFLSLARIAARQERLDLALQHVEKSLIRNYHSLSARHLNIALLRKLGKSSAAVELATQSIAIDPFNTGAFFELYLLYREMGKVEETSAARQQFDKLMRKDRNNYLELSLEYAHAGWYAEAMKVLSAYISSSEVAEPMPLYYLGWYAHNAGQAEDAGSYFLKAGQQKADGCFPNKVEEVLILRTALRYNPNDAVASYALGNFWYDKRQYAEAVRCWEQSQQANGKFPTVYRNLSLAYYNKVKNKTKALEFMELAFELDTTDARVFMELDQLYKILGKPFAERLALLNKYMGLVQQRDDLFLELVSLHNNSGEFEKAKQLLASRKFHPWEGGEGKVVSQFLLCYLQLAKEALLNNDHEHAIALLESLNKYPENLGEGKLYGTQENDIHYLLGCAYEHLQQQEKATVCFMKATEGISEPVQAIYYNDPQPDKIVYQALAWRKLGEPEKADAIFRRFIEFGELHKDDEIRIDYFAVSLPDMLVFDIDLDLRNRIHCLYLVALGHLGLGNESKARKLLNEVLELDLNHQGARTHLKMIPFFMTGVTI
jgi:tetratricopeptide (TPR) repeat protein